MKQLIMGVLEDISNDQMNLVSNTVRETIANLIVATIRSKDKGWYLNCNHTKEQEEADKKIIESHKTEERKTRESWVCSICGENTYDVVHEYIGSGTNHLGCEFEDEKRVTTDRRKSDRREKNWLQKKHEDKVFGNDLIIGIANEDDDLVNQLSEEIVPNNDTGYIYESPDGGKTVYKRKEGSDKRELVKDWEKKKQGVKVE